MAETTERMAAFNKRKNKNISWGEFKKSYKKRQRKLSKAERKFKKSQKASDKADIIESAGGKAVRLRLKVAKKLRKGKKAESQAASLYRHGGTLHQHD